MGAEIKETSGMLAHKMIRGVGATVASIAMTIQVFLSYHVLGLPLTRNACAHDQVKVQSSIKGMNGDH